MILNPVIQGGSEEKEYKVTTNVDLMLKDKYRAGEIVSMKAPITDAFYITAADGTKIPFLSNPAHMISCLFVMPAQDITITEP